MNRHFKYHRLACVPLHYGHHALRERPPRLDVRWPLQPLPSALGGSRTHIHIALINAAFPFAYEGEMLVVVGCDNTFSRLLFDLIVQCIPRLPFAPREGNDPSLSASKARARPSYRAFEMVHTVGVEPTLAAF